MRYLIKFSYDGSHFYGFQRQSSKKTVQGELENALSIIDKEKVVIKGAGRTDIGVHANGQCAHFDLHVSVPEERLIKAINSIVHPYIHVLSCTVVKNDFHARFSVKEKKYIYKIWLGAFSPFKEDYYLQYGKDLDINQLKKIASIFVGSYNFHNFVSGDRKSNYATLFSIDVVKNEQEVAIVFRGKGFYRYMVRNLVGAMLDVLEGKCDLLLLEKMLKDKKFNYQLSCASAKGLYLEEIIYE